MRRVGKSRKLKSGMEKPVSSLVTFFNGNGDETIKYNMIISMEMVQKLKW